MQRWIKLRDACQATAHHVLRCHAPVSYSLRHLGGGQLTKHLVILKFLHGKHRLPRNDLRAIRLIVNVGDSENLRRVGDSRMYIKRLGGTLLKAVKNKLRLLDLDGIAHTSTRKTGHPPHPITPLRRRLEARKNLGSGSALV